MTKFTTRIVLFTKTKQLFASISGGCVENKIEFKNEFEICNTFRQKTEFYLSEHVKF